MTALYVTLVVATFAGYVLGMVHGRLVERIAQMEDKVRAGDELAARRERRGTR